MKRRVISAILTGALSLNMFNIAVQASDFNSNLSSLSTTTATKTKIMDSFEDNKSKKNYKKDEVLIKVKDIENLELNSWLQQSYPVNVKKHLKNGLVVVTFDNNKYSLEDMLERLNKEPNIEYAEPNYSTKLKGSPSSEPYYKNLWGLKNTEYSGVDINVEPAWKALKNNAPTVVGVIDTGIDYNHEDLSKNLWINSDEIPGNGKDDDGNNYIDDYRGWNFVDENNDPYDDNEHGTHVSGTIAALNNGVGVVGVSPNTKIMPLKVGDAEGNLYNDDIIEAINYGLKEGVRIFNCSFGGGDFSQVEYDTIKNSNALFIVAAGNEGNNNDAFGSYPANYELPNIISVGSIDKNGALSSFSNYGIKTVDIAAPGGEILSTVPKGGYEYFDGTSMAAPHVAGVAALILGEKPNLTPVEVRDYILKNNRPINSLSKTIATEAIVDAGKIINLLNGSNDDSTTTPIENPEVKVNGWVSKDGNWYFYKDGQPDTGWQNIKGQWYYLGENGAMATGWRYIGSNWYYLNEDGDMATGWKLLKGKWYYLGENGAMATGWTYVGSNWYYLNEDGDMATGWKLLKGNWYYLEENGTMATGWRYLGYSWYYLNEDGDMAVGWKFYKGSWYYLEGSGVMAIGWKLVNGTWYYLYESGKMAANVNIGGYRLGPSGELIS